MHIDVKQLFIVLLFTNKILLRTKNSACITP